MNMFPKGVLVCALAASAIVAGASPAMAQDYRRGRDDTAAFAIGAGILGRMAGATAASDNDRGYYRNDGWGYRDDRAYERGRYERRDRRGNGRRGDYNRQNNWRQDGRRENGRSNDDWRRGSDGQRGNDWRRGDRQPFDSRYYGRRGYRSR